MIQCKLYESFLNESQIILVSFYTFRFDMRHSYNCNFAIGDENMIMPNGTLPGNIPLIWSNNNFFPVQVKHVNLNWF